MTTGYDFMVPSSVFTMFMRRVHLNNPLIIIFVDIVLMQMWASLDGRQGQTETPSVSMQKW